MDRIELYDQNLNRINSWISNSDSKTSYVLAFNGVMVGYIISKMPQTIGMLQSTGRSFFSVILLLFFIIYIWQFIDSLYRGFKVIFPDVEVREKSYFFFGSIAKMDKNSFKERMDTLNEKDVENQLLDQIHINSAIALHKFENIQKSIKALSVSFIFWVLFLAALGINGLL